MPSAFVLINSEIGAENKVVDAVKQIPAVQESYIVYGVYDVILRVAAPTMDELKGMILTNIRGLENVRSTLTMIVVEE
ncbi:MAG: Lrp/AsnC family transcriptional regulator [Candidatus Hodarchaeales archaeon]|jgi:DNA-binding Lrp family transcriptional regulator